MEKKKTITIYDIAKEAGVSVATVSRVVNNSNVVKPETAKKVKALIDKYDFSPNATARNLSNRKSSIIGCILPDITNPFYATLFSELERWTTFHDYVLFLGNTLSDFRIESKYLSVFQEKQVEGVIWGGGRINEASLNPTYIEEIVEFQKHTPIVMINGHVPKINCCSVEANEIGGVYKLVEYLVAEGHQNIGFIGGIKGITTYDAKLRAFKRKLNELGLKSNKKWIIPGSFDVESGIIGFKGLLEVKPFPTALLCINDMVAIGVIIAAQRNGIMVPEDLSVCGFDDISLSKNFFPDITTVNQNYYELASNAMSILLGRIKGQPVKKNVKVETLISIRNSTKRAV